jgi:MoaA/NifB/PqqE/SkfB family radical SAM enzyme
MYEVEKLNNSLSSLSLFVGTGNCNANCNHCAGKPLRKYAPEKDGVINETLINETLKKCYVRGARYLSISSSGEPTLSPLAVTRTLELVNICKNEGLEYSPINLYSNGIRIGEDSSFCKEYLSLWKNLGLTTIYLTIHNLDEKRNAQIYGVKSYPKFEDIFFKIHNAKLKIRANLVLSKNTIPYVDDFIFTILALRKKGVDSVSAWPIRTLDDKVNVELAPIKSELDKMNIWVKENSNSNFLIRLLMEENQELYKKGKKLTLFPDGTLSSTWCNQ